MEFTRDLQAFRTYMSVSRGLSERTAIEYCRDVDRFQRAAGVKRFDDLKPKKLTRRMREWTTSLMVDGSNKPQSVHRKIAALHAFCKWLVRERRLKKNPAEELERPKCEKRLPVCATEIEVGRFLDARIKRRNPAHELRDHAMLELMYGSGLRRAEVCGVDVGSLVADSNAMRVVGKGNKERVVFLSGPSIDALRAYLATRPDAQPADPMFLTARKGRMKVRQLWCIFRDYRNVVGLTKHITPHTFRHSFATHMIEHGADIVTVKELLGHANISTTNTYANVSQAHMRGTFEATHPRAKAA